MPVEVLRLDVRQRRRSLVGYSLGMATYALVVVALYPTFKDDASLNSFTEDSSTIAALFGASGSLTTSAGWLNANLYGNFVPLLVLLMTIGYGAWAIAGQTEEGTLGMVATLPVARRWLAGQKALAVALLSLPVPLVTAGCVVIGRSFELSVSTAGLVSITAGSVLLGIDLGLLALAIGAATASRGTALGVTSAVAAASYLISSLAPVVGWIRPARFASPFFYAVGDGQLHDGLKAADLVPLAVVGAVLCLVALRSFARLDVD